MKYTAEIYQAVKSLTSDGYSQKSIASQINSRFGTNFTQPQVSYMLRKGLTGLKKRKSASRQKKATTKVALLADIANSNLRGSTKLALIESLVG